MSHDWAWSEGTRQLELEANDTRTHDITFTCAGCGEPHEVYWRDELELVTLPDDHHRWPGQQVWISKRYCAECANDPTCFDHTTPREFNVGQDVRFRECPSLVGEVTARTRGDDGEWRYTVRGREGSILGPPYRAKHLEAC